MQPDTGSAGDGAAAWDEDRAKDLYNQWLPLLRLLHARHDSFVATAPVTRGTAAVPATLTAAHQRALQVEAEQALAAGDPVSALEAWTAIWRGTTGTPGDEPAQERVSLL